MSDKYKDIIGLPHKQSDRRPHMSVHDRAAQFSAFAALTGYDSAIKEIERLTDEKLTLSEAQLEQLDRKLNILENSLSFAPTASVTFFEEDLRKSGGKYITLEGVVKKVDRCSHMLVMQSGEKIFIDDIICLEGDIFGEE